MTCPDRISRYAHYYMAGHDEGTAPYAEMELVDQRGSRGLMLDVDPGYAEVFCGDDVQNGNHLQLAFFLNAR